ncbi:MAG: septum formation protein Maf [Planctomycetes bacterium]|nr:septum formation protein Maf [Planctomycetota bacterium]
MDLVLASTSTYRRLLLERLRLPFRCERPGVDEDAVKRSGLAPLAVVQELARQKARAVAARCPDAIVVGSDQAAVVDGTILDKPGTVAAAHAQLGRLAGRTHTLLTAVAVVHPGGEREFVDTTTLTMRPLHTREIERYVAAESPLDCAGSYKIEGLGITLFTRIDSDDHTAIVGLPLLALAQVLRDLDVPLP